MALTWTVLDESSQNVLNEPNGMDAEHGLKMAHGPVMDEGVLGPHVPGR